MGFIEITGTFGPTGANVGSPAGFATHEANFGLGGYMQVADNTERNAITADRRSQGMAVYVNADNKLYVLKDGVTDNDWVEFSGGGTGGSINITDGTTTITGASELDLDDENFVVTAGTPNTVAEVNTAYNTSIDPATSVAININDLNSLTAADFLGLSTTEVLNKLLFPTIQPSYIPGPSTSLVNSQTATVEIGSQVTSNLSLSLIKNNSGGLDTGTPATITSSVGGSLTLSGPTTTTNPPNNLADQFGYANANNPNEKYEYTTTETVTMPASGSINYSSSISWLQGNQLKDSTGTDSGTPIAAGTGNPSNSVSGIYPWFYYYSPNPITVADMQTAINNGTATKQISSSTGTIDVPFIVTGEYLAVAYPATSTSKTIFFVNQTNQGNITVIFDPLGPAVPVTETGNLWSNIDYKIHVSIGPQSSTATPLELRNN